MSSHHVSTVSCVTTFCGSRNREKEGVGKAFFVSAERDRGMERNTATRTRQGSIAASTSKVQGRETVPAIQVVELVNVLRAAAAPAPAAGTEDRREVFASSWPGC